MIEYISNLCKRISSFLRRESVYYAPASKIKEWSFGILDKGIWKYFEKNFFPGGVELIIRNREGLNNYRTEPLPILSRGPTLSDSSNHSERRGLEEKIEIKAENKDKKIKKSKDSLAEASESKEVPEVKKDSEDKEKKEKKEDKTKIKKVKSKKVKE